MPGLFHEWRKAFEEAFPDWRIPHTKTETNGEDVGPVIPGSMPASSHAKPQAHSVLREGEES